MIGRLIKKINHEPVEKKAIKSQSLVKGVVLDPIKLKKSPKEDYEDGDEFENRLKRGLGSRADINLSYQSKSKQNSRFRKIFTNLIRGKIKKDWFYSIYIYLYIILFVLIFRLIFMEQGVIHYFVKINELKTLVQTIHDTQMENNDMIKKIKLINSNKTYQKKITRDLLGVIAPDEYLIIFAQESTPHSK